MPSVSLFDIISVVVPDPKIFLCIPASTADAAAVNSNLIETLLANGLVFLHTKSFTTLMTQTIFILALAL